MPPMSALQPASSPHSRPAASRGVKRPRKAVNGASLPPASENLPLGGPSSSSSHTAPESDPASPFSHAPSVGPRDIVGAKARSTQLAQDDSLAYSATPPSMPAKKLSTDGSHRRLKSRSGSNDSGGSGEGSSRGLGSDKPAPIKSALASSARLAAGPPGSSSPFASGSTVSERYKRSMYISFVDNAFAERDKGSTKSYWDLVAQFRSSAIAPGASSSTQSLSIWLFALSHHVSRLDRANHTQLVENILDLPWAAASDEFVKSWCRFVCALVSARVEWAGSILSRIVKAMRWRSDWLPIQPVKPPSPPPLVGGASSSSSSQPQPTRRLLYTRIHMLLRAILSLVPTLPTTLNPLLAKHFPHKRDNKRDQSTFVRNILFVTRYENQVAETVWRLVADRAIGLDVEIQIELDDLEDEAKADGLDTDGILDPFDKVIDDDDDSDSDDSDDDDQEGGTGLDDLSEDEDADADEDLGMDGAIVHEAEAERRERKVRELVDKLDHLMKVCFEHLESIGKIPSKGKSAFAGLILDQRPTWLSDFLGTSGSSASTPTAEVPSGFSSPFIKDEDGSDDDSKRGGLTPSRRDSNAAFFDSEAFQASKEALFHHLLHLFSRSILPTFKCRHVQFLLFWYCSLESDFADFLLGFLIHKAIYTAEDDGASGNAGSGHGGSDNHADRGRAEPMVLRQAAASYVASFVSRAKYISPSYTRTVVYNLCSYLEAHLEAHSNAVATANASQGGIYSLDEKMKRLALAPPGSEEHAIFYAVAQAVFYIFCFRWQDLQPANHEVKTAAEEALKNGDESDMEDEMRNRRQATADADEWEVDGGLLIGSLSSTGSSSFAGLPESYTRRYPSRSHEDDQSSSFKSPSLGPVADGDDVPPPPSGAASAWSPGLQVLQRAILSPLNPLHYCSPTVVRQFASVAQHVGFLYCWSVIEANKRAMVSSQPRGSPSMQNNAKPLSRPKQPSTNHHLKAPTADASLSSATTPSAVAVNPNTVTARNVVLDLEGFFPFDPYRLSSTCQRFVQPLYREWDQVAPSGMGDDEAEEDDDDDGDDDGSDTTGEQGSDSSSSSSSEDDDDDDEEEDEEATNSQRPGSQLLGGEATRATQSSSSISSASSPTRPSLAVPQARSANLRIPGTGPGSGSAKSPRRSRRIGDDTDDQEDEEEEEEGVEEGKFARSLQMMSVSGE